MKKYILFFLFCAITTVLQAATTTLTNSQQWAETVLSTITDAIGASKKVPTIQVRGGRSNIAEYNALEHKIYIDHSAVLVCEQLALYPESALAFLIGHELAHFYQQEEWETTAAAFLSPSEEFTEKKQQEQEADVYGAFISHLAGYETVQVIPTLLKNLYQDYKIEQDASYPSISERMEVAHQVCEHVSRLLEVHDAANYAMVIGDYSNALAAYEYLSQFVGYRELYNNIGVASLSNARSIPNNALAFLYPVTIEQDIPLRRLVEQERTVLLNKAIAAFQRAIPYGEVDYSTSLNLACAYELSNRQEDFSSLVQQLKQASSSSMLAGKIAIIEGIYEARSDKNKAIQFFNKAIKISDNKAIATIAKYNKKVIRKSLKKYPSVKSINLHVDTTIDGIDLFTFDSQEGNKHILNNRSLYITRSENTHIFTFQQREYATKINYTTASTLSTSTGIRKGHTVADLIREYGNSSLPTLTTNANYYVAYLEQGLFFKLNYNNVIVGWGTFIL